MAKRKSERPLVAVGDAFAVPLSNGMWGGCRVIRVGGLAPTGRHRPSLLEVGSLAWTGTLPPIGSEPDIAKLLVRHRHGYHLAITWISGPIPAAFVPIRPIAPLPSDLTRTIYAWATEWDSIAAQILEEWRWQHEREALLREDQAKLERLANEDRARIDVRRRQLDSLSLAKMRTERPFADWRGVWPAAAISEARRIFRETIDQLITLGPNRSLLAARPILRACIERFNALNAAQDRFIATDEREAIAEHFARLVHVAGLAEYGSGDLTEQWRDW